MDLLVESGYECVTFSKLIWRLSSSEVAGAPDVDPSATRNGLAVITFNDGYADFQVNAVPVLTERSLVASLHLSTGWLKGSGVRGPGRATTCWRGLSCRSWWQLASSWEHTATAIRTWTR
jgi:hypothetical protein